MSTLQKRLVIGIGVISVMALFIKHHYTETGLRQENWALRQQIDVLSNGVAQTASAEPPSPWSPSPRAGARPLERAKARPDSASQQLETNKVMARVLRGDPFKPTVAGEQLESYLNQNQRSAASLLASSRLTRDQTLLEEAIAKYPHDPRVNFSALFKTDSSPEERRQWLDTFKQAAPDNALADYLSAREFFKSGQIDEAVRELSAAFGKRDFEDYFMEFSQHEEEAWSAAGYSTAEAKVFSAWSLGYPHLAELKALGRDIVSLADSYRQGGDQSSAEVALQMIVNLGLHLDEAPGQPYPSRKTHVDLDIIAFEAMKPTSAYGAGQTVNDRLTELARQRDLLDQLEAQGDQPTLRQKVSDQDWITYKDRWRAFGEETALQWLVAKYGER
jgi:hypothetical protein